MINIFQTTLSNINKFLNKWNEIQNQYNHIPGTIGIELRKKYYSPFFLKIGKNVVIDVNCYFTHPHRIILEDNVRINREACIYGSGGIYIGRNVLIGPRIFIHSANHDISILDKAFFECPYKYKQVIIGDNSLISANVSILPGCNIGPASFVACSATVTGKTYPAHSYLYGIPAQNHPQPINSTSDFIHSPSIGIITNKNKYHESCKLLIGLLGLPQINVFDSIDNLPKSIHTIILFEPQTFNNLKHLDIWYIMPTNTIVEKCHLLIDLNHTCSMQLNLCDKQTYKYAPNINHALKLEENAFKLHCYYYLKRINKNPALLSTPQELIQLLLLIVIGCKLNYLDVIAKIASATLPHYPKSWKFKKLNILIKTLITHPSNTTIISNIARLIIRKFYPSFYRLLLPKENVITLDKTTFIKSPEIALLLTLINKPVTLNIPALISSTKTTNHLVILYLFTYLTSCAQDMQTIYQILINKHLNHNFMMLTTAIDKSNSILYSPLSIMFFLINCHNYYKLFQEIYYEETIDIKWHVFDELDSKWLISNKVRQFSLVNINEQIISSSLIDNWITNMSIPKTISGYQYEITANSYSNNIHTIEMSWLSIFKFILHKNNQPLLKLKPWPFPYNTALSLRYDIDRVTTTDQVLNIIDIQRNWLNANCATWYEIPNTNNISHHLLTIHHQELGQHLLNTTNNIVSDQRGVTMHSAPGAEYWQGTTTIINNQNNNALYTEMLGTQYYRPRPGIFDCIDSNGTDHIAKLWLLPLHFPLEGSTSEQNLDYFDVLIDEFKYLNSIGGHIIIASHPDLNQKLLVTLLQREKLANCWNANINNVVARCKYIFGYNNIKIGTLADSQDFYLLSNDTIADLAIEILPPNPSEDVCTTNLQLNANIPRKFSLYAKLK